MGRLLGKQHIRDLCLALGLLCSALALILWPEEAMAAMKDGLWTKESEEALLATE